MVKVRIIILTIITTLIILSLFSCAIDDSSNNTSVVTATDKDGDIVTKDISDVEVELGQFSFETREEYGHISGQNHLEYLSYGDYTFDMYSKMGDILFKNIKNPSESISVFLDPLSAESGIESIGVWGEIRFMLIDEYETERNGGVPIIVLLVETERNNNGIPEECTIALKYNIKNRNVTIISDELPAHPLSFDLFGEYYYMTYNDGDDGYGILRVDFDGNVIIKDNPEKRMGRIRAINNEYIYVSEIGTGEIYRCTVDLKNEELIYKTTSESIVLCDDEYVYTYDSQLIPTNETGINSFYSNMIRIPQNGNGEAELFMEKMIDPWYKNGVFYRSGFGPKYYGNVLYNSNNIIYAFDPETKEERIIADFSDRENDVADIMHISGNVMTIQFMCYSTDKTINYPIKYVTCHLDLETGVMTEMFIIDVDPVTGIFTFR